jgi:phosphoadenosine phosphosulfate reductase
VDGRTKFNPLADWSAERIADELARRDLKRHPLAAHGFPSIGCAPCTRAVRPGEDARAGRWAGHAKTECGIHRPAFF